MSVLFKGAELQIHFDQLKAAVDRLVEMLDTLSLKEENR